MREETESIVATIAFKTIGTHEVSLWEHGFVDIEDERFEYKLDYKLDHARLPLEEAYWLLDFLNTHLPPQSHITSEAVGTHTFTLREDGILEIVGELSQSCEETNLDHTRLDLQEVSLLRDFLLAHLPLRS